MDNQPKSIIMNTQYYFISNIDKQIHNINDVKHNQIYEINTEIIDDNNQVIDNVTLYKGILGLKVLIKILSGERI